MACDFKKGAISTRPRARRNRVAICGTMPMRREAKSAVSSKPREADAARKPLNRSRGAVSVGSFASTSYAGGISSPAPVGTVTATLGTRSSTPAMRVSTAGENSMLPSAKVVRSGRGPGGSNTACVSASRPPRRNQDQPNPPLSTGVDDDAGVVLGDGAERPLRLGGARFTAGTLRNRRRRPPRETTVGGGSSGGPGVSSSEGGGATGMRARSVAEARGLPSLGPRPPPRSPVARRSPRGRPMRPW